MLAALQVVALLLAQAAPVEAPAVPSGPAAVSIPLPGGPPVSMDYLAYDAVRDRVWAPGGNTGKVFVVDARTLGVTAVEGFASETVAGRDGQPRVIGPSAASVGDGVVYVGNRAGKQLCAVDAATLVRGPCLALPAVPDGVAWVATTREVWVTTPRDGSITVVRTGPGGALSVAGRIPLPHPEGYAVDARRGLFYVNEEEEDRTLAIDVRTRSIVATWTPGCGADGPRGLALDAERRQLAVACTTGVVILDAGGDGRVLGRLEVGAGIDNIDTWPGRHQVLAAAGRAATLTAVAVDGQGKPSLAWATRGAAGGRVVVVDARGGAWIADSRGGRLVLVPARP
jgi:hypothetical protein